jgi:hypothetical protein
MNEWRNNESNKPTRKAPKSEELKPLRRQKMFTSVLLNSRKNKLLWEARIPNWQR